MQVIFGLGSNMGDRAEMLARAVDALSRHFEPLRCSRVYESAAVLPKDAPAEWNMPYLNMAVAGHSRDAPVALLAIAKAVEQRLGRKESDRWGPRRIDIDILALGDTVLHSRTLTLPHRELLKRDFALLPLAEVAPGWHYPCAGAMQGMRPAEMALQLNFAPHAGCRLTGIEIHG